MDDPWVRLHMDNHFTRFDPSSSTLRYCPSSKRLEWKRDDAGPWLDIDLETVISFVPSSRGGRAWDMLFTESQDEAPHLEVNIVTVAQPTKALFDDFVLPEHSFFQALSQSKAEKLLRVIISEHSGVRHAENFYYHTVLPYVQYLVKCICTRADIHATTSANSITEITLRDILPAANNGEEQNILLLSGDGGMVDILNALSSQPHSKEYCNPNIALLPLGTGNALANSYGILADLTHGLRTLTCGSPRELPAFRASFSPGARYLVDEARSEAPLHCLNGLPTVLGCVVCSWALHAALVADSDTSEYREFGAERFKMAANAALFPAHGALPHAYKGKVKYLSAAKDEWKTINRNEHGYVLSTLVSHLEAGFNISPLSLPLDGILRLVNFEPVSGKDAMDIMGKAYQGGQHVQDARVEYSAIRALRIEFDEDDEQWRRICIDGKIVRVEKNGWVEVRTDDIHSGINLVVYP